MGGRSSAWTIRETRGADLADILALYPLAFPDEDLRPLVSDLMTGEVETLSLAAILDDEPVGHVLFTLFDSEGGRGALLGPLAVGPSSQRRGAGSALVAEGLTRLSATETAQVFLLGDPAYYGRFGFRPERRISAPYPLPPEWGEAWQSLALPGRTSLGIDRCILPALWMNPALWAP